MKLKRYLEREGISTADFASRLGVTYEAVRLYVRGERIPSRKNAAKIRELTKGSVRERDFIESSAA